MHNSIVILYVTIRYWLFVDQRKFGPSPMKAKQQQQLDNVIKKNAAIKDMPSANYGSR